GQARPADHGAALRIPLLEGDRELRGAGAARHDRRQRPRAGELRRFAAAGVRSAAQAAAPARRARHRPRDRRIGDARPAAIDCRSIGRGSAVMPVPKEQQRALLLRVARQAMIEHGLEPDFPPAAFAEADALSESGPREPGVPDLRSLPWCSIDNDDSRDLDQLTVVEPSGNGVVKIMVAIADVSSAVLPRSALDTHAGINTTSV